MHPCEELWISRAIDRTATAEDWAALSALANDDPDVWRRLGVTLREDALLGTMLGTQLGAMLSVPVAVATPIGMVAPAAMPRRRARGFVVAFATAAALLLAFWCGRHSASVSAAAGAMPMAAPAGAGDVDGRSADQLFDAYVAAGVRSGRVLEQLPFRTLATRRLPDDHGMEVVFVRSLVERALVERALTLVADEHGRPAPLAIDPASLASPTNY